MREELLVPSDTRTRCPFKGEASYHSLRVGDRTIDDAVWEYSEPLEPASFIAGYRALYWERVDEWFVEDAQALGHPRDPYHRIDVYPSTQHVRVTLDGEVLADSPRAKVVFETGHPPRHYLPPEDVRVDLLEVSETKTRCAYKGSASYFSALGHDDVAWVYREPQHDGEPLRDLIAFDGEKVDVDLD